MNFDEITSQNSKIAKQELVPSQEVSFLEHPMPTVEEVLKEHKKVLIKVMGKIIEDSVWANLAQKDFSMFPSALHPALERWSSKTGKFTHYMITCRPDEKVHKLSELITKTEKAVCKNMVLSYVYAYEQSGELPGEYPGFHVHLLVDCGKSEFARVQAGFRSTFNSLLGGNLNVNIKGIPQSDIAQARNYITGVKHDAKKHLKQANDILFRNHHKLKPFYESDIVSPP